MGGKKRGAEVAARVRDSASRTVQGGGVPGAGGGASMKDGSPGAVASRGLCDRTLLLHQGRIVDRGTVAELLTRAGASNLTDAFLRLIAHPASVRPSTASS